MVRKDTITVTAPKAQKFYCCGEYCPGLPYRASDIQHPYSCAYGPGFIEEDELVIEDDERPALIIVVQGLDPEDF